MKKTILFLAGAVLSLGFMTAYAADKGTYRIVVKAVNTGLPVEAKLYSGDYDAHKNCLPNNKVFVYVKKQSEGTMSGQLSVTGSNSAIFRSGDCIGLVVYNPNNAKGFEYCRASWPMSMMKTLLKKGGVHTDQVMVYKAGKDRGVCSLSFDVGTHE